MHCKLQKLPALQNCCSMEIKPACLSTECKVSEKNKNSPHKQFFESILRTPCHRPTACTIPGHQRGENTPRKALDFSSKPTTQLRGSSSLHAQGQKRQTKALLCWTRRTGAAASATSSDTGQLSEGISTGTQINKAHLDPQG